MLLVNPNAGKGGYKAVLPDVLQTFYAGGWEPTVFFTQARGDGTRLVETYAPEHELVVCLGGDGTLSEVAAGQMRLGEEQRPIGYIPLGTANDVARTLGIPFKPVEAAKRILQGKPCSLDMGQFGLNDYFTYIAAFGAFTEVSYGTPQETKQALGHLAYMLEGIRQLPKITDYHAIVEYDNGVLEDNFVFGAVTNSTSVAGLVRLNNGEVNLADGLFEVLLVKKPQDLLELSGIISAIMSMDFSGSNILFLKSSEVRIMFDQPVAWTRDGEDGETHRDVMITNRHPGVEIIL